MTIYILYYIIIIYIIIIIQNILYTSLLNVSYKHHFSITCYIWYSVIIESIIEECMKSKDINTYYKLIIKTNDNDMITILISCMSHT